MASRARRHQLLVEMHVRPAQQHGAEHLAAFHQMMQIGARVLRRWTGAFRIERAFVLGIFGVAQIEPAAPGEGLVMAARARRHHAVEHVDAAGNGFEQILRRADAHQIARPILRQHRSGHRDGVEHGGLPFTHRQPADRIAVEADVLQNPGALLSEVGIDAALHDAEQRLARRGHLLKCLLRALGPAHRQLH